MSVPRPDPRDVAEVMSANRPRLMGIAASIQTVTRTIDLERKDAK